MRVLYLAMSPDGQTIVTGAGDETLRFWNTFPSMKTPVSIICCCYHRGCFDGFISLLTNVSQAPVKDIGLWSLGRTQIR